MNAMAREEKVALLLQSLAPPAAESVLEQLNPARRNRVRGLMQQSQGPPADESLNQTLRELADALSRPSSRESRPALRIAAGTAADRAGESVPNQHDAAADRSTSPAVFDPSDPVVAVRAMDVQRLIATLEGEHPQSIAVVLNCLESAKAADIMKSLSAELRRNVFLRLGQVSASAGDLEARIVQAIVEKSRSVADGSATQRGDSKIQKMAEVLKLMERGDRMELIAALDSQDSATAASVRDRLYLFEDLRRIDDRSVQKLLAEIDSKTLAMSLKGAADDLTQKVMNNLSKRGREMVSEEISFLGNVPPGQIQQAQKAIVDVIQRLDQSGELIMNS